MKQKHVMLITSLIAVCFMLVLVGCSSSSSDSPNNTPSVSASTASVAPAANSQTIKTPFYSVAIPADRYGDVQWFYSGSEGTYVQKPSWDSDIIWNGHRLEVKLNEDESFSLIASRDGKDGAVFQGSFAVQEVGKAEACGRSWTIYAYSTKMSLADPDRAQHEERLAEYASWVSVGFDPMSVEDDRVFVSFLGSLCGEEWSHDGNEQAVLARLGKIMQSGTWSAVSGIETGKVIERDAISSFAVESFAIDGNEVIFDTPGLRAESRQLQTDLGQCLFFPADNNGVLLEVKSWERGKIAILGARSKVELQVITSYDGGSTWKKATAFLYLPDDAQGSGVESMGQLVFDMNQRTYTLNDESFQAVEGSQAEYVEDAKRLLSRAGVDSLRVRNSGKTIISLPIENVLWAQPARFEDYKFNPADGYFAVVAFAGKGSNLEDQMLNGAGYYSGEYDLFEQDTCATLAVYDYGNGSVMVKPMQ